MAQAQHRLAWQQGGIALEFVKGYSSVQVQPIAILGMDSGFISPGFISTLGADAKMS